MRRRGPVTVLVYYPDAREAKAYAAHVSARRDRVRVVTCATPAEAAAVITDADVLYAWKFPPDLYARAPRLAWLQAMGAGVDWALVPTLRDDVVITRVPGVFGPWMRENLVPLLARDTERSVAEVIA